MKLLIGLGWHKIRSRVLFVHHADDGCFDTPYHEAQRSPCEPTRAHRFFGREAEIVDAIAARMLAKPFPQVIR